MQIIADNEWTFSECSKCLFCITLRFGVCNCVITLASVCIRSNVIMIYFILFEIVMLWLLLWLQLTGRPLDLAMQLSGVSVVASHKYNAFIISRFLWKLILNLIFSFIFVFVLCPGNFSAFILNCTRKLEIVYDVWCMKYDEKPNAANRMHASLWLQNCFL